MTPDDINNRHAKRKQQIPDGITRHPHYMYLLCKKNMPRDVDFKEFRMVLDAMSEHIKHRLFRGGTVTLPYGMGVLCVKQASHGVYLDEDGNCRSSYPVNWKKTMQLWCDDEEARANKTKVYNMNKKRSLYLCFTPGLSAVQKGLNIRIKRMRKFIFEVTEYADTHKEVSYAIRKRVHER